MPIPSAGYHPGMEQQAILDLLYADPFRPFRFVLKNGDVVDVPDTAIIAAPGWVVWVTKLDADGELTDEVWKFTRADIDRFEYAEEPAAVSG